MKRGITRQLVLLAKQARFRVKDLARLCNLSPRQLERQFRRAFGCGPHVWLNRRRLSAAKRLLRAGFSVKYAALELGFGHSSNFCRSFRTRYGESVSQFLSNE